MLNGMPYGIQQPTIHRDVLQYMLFFAGDNILAVKQVKLIDFTIIPNFLVVNFNYVFRHILIRQVPAYPAYYAVFLNNKDTEIYDISVLYNTRQEGKRTGNRRRSCAGSK